jgi:ABC-2 type transport system permease protein
MAIKNAQSKVNISLAKASGEKSKGLNEIKIAIGVDFT